MIMIRERYVIMLQEIDVNNFSFVKYDMRMMNDYDVKYILNKKMKNATLLNLRFGYMHEYLDLYCL